MRVWRWILLLVIVAALAAIGWHWVAADPGYVLLRLGKSRADTGALGKAFAAIGAPFTTLDIPDESARALYGYDLILLRPDMHIVWRGNAPPDDAVALARLATGHAS